MDFSGLDSWSFSYRNVFFHLQADYSLMAIYSSNLSNSPCAVTNHVCFFLKYDTHNTLLAQLHPIRHHESQAQAKTMGSHPTHTHISKHITKAKVKGAGNNRELLRIPHNNAETPMLASYTNIIADPDNTIIASNNSIINHPSAFLRTPMPH